jgi:hypothetical protein
MEKTTVGYSVNVTRADVMQAVKAVALRRLLEQSPGLALDPADWYERAEVVLPDGVSSVPVSLAR